MSTQPPLLTLQGAEIRFGPKPLFTGLDLTIRRGERAALVGRNGSGKSTLLKLLASRIEPDAGTVWVQPGTAIAYLEQEPDLAGFETVRDAVAAGLPADRRMDLHRADALIAKVGLGPETDPATLSGGGKRRVALAAILAAEPDVLLLDEPTNHLDLPTIEWLEGLMAGFNGAILTISHDRAFLDAVVNTVHWLDRGTLRTASISFKAFDDWVEKVLEDEAREAERLDRKIAEETRWLREGLTARRKRNMGRVRALHDMRAARQDRVSAPGRASFDAAEADRGGTMVLEAENICKAFDGPEGRVVVADGFSTRMVRGDRVGVIGPNGAGKTTLIQMLIGRVPPDSGRVRLGTGVKIAYFDQTRSTLSTSATIRDTLLPQGGDTIFVGDKPRHIASYARDFLFEPSRLDSPVSSLSGGERNRLLLAAQFARPSNLMVMDEPTNDLDMETLDVLQDVLSDFAGTLILISHDRDFLDRMVTSTIAVEGNGEIVEYAGGYSDYAARKRAIDGEAEGPKPATRKGAGKARDQAPKPKSAPTKLSYKDQRALEQLPARIDVLQGEIAELEARLADADYFRRDAAGFNRDTARITAAREELDDAENRWLELAMAVEEMGKS
ncbi:ATP-binding cassette domain-containing protein [Fodinicurvata sp. EGI_FJ10296]|uniref:ABC-F family ATP-binding cassette domain-containing protein n=1 Tax=Fodinicurvata sp. EGI_FJ10296 TaxID=3231908 RepID=UPI0034514013